jgi:uncharacterized protein (TIGR03118 family)
MTNGSIQCDRPRTQRLRSARSAGRPESLGRAGALAAGVAVATALMPAVATAGSALTAPNKFAQTNLVANNSTQGAKLVDPNLTNAWGLATAAGSPLWVSDNNSGKATVYSGGINGGAVSLDLTVPVPGGNPTGQVANPTPDFPVGGTTGSASIFIVDTDSIGTTQSPGEIAAWNGGATFVVEDSPTGGPGGTTPTGAVFKGLAISALPTAGPELFAADVANAHIDVFNKDFAPVSTPTEFVDPAIPKGYAPFNVQALGKNIYVTYGKQNAAKTNVVPGAGLGFVDKYSPNGVLQKHLVSGGAGSPLNEPWGLAFAPQGFGPFAGKLLVGNRGNGWINVFDPGTGAHLGALQNTSGAPIVIPGLWGLRVGNAAFGGSNALVFSSGPNNYASGLVGILTPTP